MRGSVVSLLLAALVIGACSRDSQDIATASSPAIRVDLPERADCDSGRVEPSSDELEVVRVAELCLDGHYGDYLVWTERQVKADDDGAGLPELALRELWRGAAFVDVLVGVEVADGVAEIRFPEGHYKTADWDDAYGTAQQMREFFPPFLATMFQFDGIDEIAMLFGEELWFPDESENREPYRREDWVSLPTGPRAVPPQSPLAAVEPFADRMVERHVEDTWLDSIVSVAPRAASIVVGTVLVPEDDDVANEVALAARVILDEKRDYCEIGVHVLDVEGTPFDVDTPGRC